MPRRLAVIMAGDIVGYSRLMAEDEEATHAVVRSVMTDVVSPAISSGNGCIFKTTGDGFLASFGSVGEALDAALAIQRGMSDASLRFRLGLNLGDVIEEDGDVFGDGVNIAARLEAMAEPGSIYVSVAIVRAAGRNPNIRFERVGHRRGKNLPEAIETYVVRPSRGSPTLSLLRRHARAAGIGGAALASLALIGFTVDNGRPAAVFNDLIAGISASTSADIEAPSVAVLPFDNLNGDDGDDYFTDGLTEDIINDLARNHELMVIARNSTFAYKDMPTDLRTVGNQLGARYIVEGSARRAGDELRVVAQLIDASTGLHLWSRSYDRDLSDIFGVKDELTAEISASLVSYVRQSEEVAAADRPTDNIRAYDLVLQGRDRYTRDPADPEAMLEARDLFSRAIELDPGYAIARAQLGKTYIVGYLKDLTGDASRGDLDRGLALAREAIRLEPELALGFQVLSYGLSGAGDYAGAMQAAERAVDLNPSDPDSQMALAKAELRFGIYEDAVVHAERARRLHPLAPKYYPYIHAQTLYAVGRYTDADAALGECLLQVPDDRHCLMVRAAVLVRLDQPEAARAAMVRLTEVDPQFSLTSEREYRRFGDTPLMENFFSDLKAAGAPERAAQV